VLGGLGSIAGKREWMGREMLLSRVVGSIGVVDEVSSVLAAVVVGEDGGAVQVNRSERKLSRGERACGVSIVAE
jgi:hypothetical protein